MVGNYQPVSIQPCFGKNFEITFFKRFLALIKSNNILNESQFGFRKGLSTNDATFALLKDVYYHLDLQEEDLLCLLYDTAKAFDLINNDELLKKLQTLDVGQYSTKVDCFQTKGSKAGRHLEALGLTVCTLPGKTNCVISHQCGLVPRIESNTNHWAFLCSLLKFPGINLIFLLKKSMLQSGIRQFCTTPLDLGTHL